MTGSGFRLATLLVAALFLPGAITTTGQTYSVLKSFTGSDGTGPAGALVLSGDTLYGATVNGGSINSGTIFKVNTDGSGYTVLKYLGGSAGKHSYGRLVLSGSTLYGTTFGDGQYGPDFGNVFKVDTNGSGFTVLKAFTGGSGGSSPEAGLILSGTTLYGTTYAGGSAFYGTVFKVDTNGTGFTVLKSFTGTDGATPSAALVLVNDTLYGTTLNGGSQSAGTVFKLNTNGSGYSVLLNAYRGPEGLTLSGSTLYVADSAFNDCGGYLSKLNTDGSGYANLQFFDGHGSSAAVVSGNVLYGSWGSSPCSGHSKDAVVYMMNTSGSGFAVLKTFIGAASGAGSPGELLLAGNALYGTTYGGGDFGYGVIFKIALPRYVPVFSDSFDTDSSANWIINRSSADTLATFNYDYSADGIPSAPNSAGGTTRGLKLKANLANGVVAALNMSPGGQSFAGDYRLHFDLWINANINGAGPTEHFTAGIGTAGNRVEWTGAGSTADGLWFAVDGEGGVGDTSTTAGDFEAFLGTAFQSAASGVYAAGTASNCRGNGNAYYAATFPSGQTAPAAQGQSGSLAVGTVGLRWRDVIINKQGTNVTWFIDGLQIASFTNITFAASNIFVGYWDEFASVSGSPSLSFALVDNLRMEAAVDSIQILSQSQDQTVACHSNVTLTVTALGTSPSYQWRKAGAPISGATASTLTISDALCADTAAYSVMLSNLAGTTTSAPVVLTVLDTNPPVIACPANMVLSTAPGECSAVATYTATATDDCSVVSLVLTPLSGSVFSKGTNTVVCTATDCAGNSNTCSFTVTVLDQEPPALTCPTNQTVSCLTTNGAQVFFSATASDNCDGPVPVVCTPPSGSFFRPGATTVTCVATDSSGNTNSCSFTITAVLTNTGIFPPTAAAYGRTYSEWSAAWWAWNFSLPSTNHPLLDTGDVSAGQSGPVWFLGGVFGASGTRVRNCTIPEGTALYFPIVNAWADNSDCPNPDNFTEAELRGFARGIQDQANGMSCTIDGVAVAGLDDPTNTPYRVQSPVFDYLLPAVHNLLYDVLGATCYTNDTGVPLGVTGAVADGVFLMLPPLSVGSHTIHFTGAVGNPASFTEDITYNITVVSDLGNAAVFPPAAKLFGKTYGEWSAAWWQWCFSLPTGGHPLFDTADCSAGQNGPVWFLGGTFGASGTRTRNCSVPDGKFLFFPLINNWADNTDCPQDSFTEAQLRAIAKGNQDQATNLSCTIDGVPVAGLSDPLQTPYRATSPVFTYTIPGSDNLLSYLGLSCYTNAAGTPFLVDADAVADGVFLMLLPLGAGTHTIHFTGAIGDQPSFSQDITYNLTVTAPALGISLQGGNVVLSWPQTSTSYVLEQSDGLVPANWSQSTAPVTVSGGNWQAKIPIAGGGKFFRLRSVGANLFGRSLAQWQEAYWRWNLGSPQPVPTTDANGNAAIGNVVLMALPSAPGDGTPASTNVTLSASQAFVLPLWNLLGNSYTAVSGFPPDDLIPLNVFQTLDLQLKLDAVTLIDGSNLMQYFSQFSFVPPIPYDSSPAAAYIWLQGVGMVHEPLSPGNHILKLDAKNTDTADLFGLTFEYHNTWNVSVQQ